MAVCVVVELNSDLAATVMRLWDELEQRWGLRRAHRGEPPHLTLAVVRGDVPVAALQPVLAPVAAAWTPVRTTGNSFGVFVAHGASSSPVLHLALTRNARLAALHEAVVAAVGSAGGDVDGQYEPEFWRPHVTLADCGLTPAVAGEILRHLLESGPRHWTLTVDNLAVVTAGDETAFRLPLAARGVGPRHLRSPESQGGRTVAAAEARDPEMAAQFEVLERDECLRLMAGTSVGRIGFTAGGLLHILPVNFALEGERIVFRTAEGTVLNRTALSRVAFEVDSMDEVTRTGWSVLVQGVAQDIGEAIDPTSESMRRLALVSWAPGSKPRWFDVVPETITGRRIRVAPDPGPAPDPEPG